MCLYKIKIFSPRMDVCERYFGQRLINQPKKKKGNAIGALAPACRVSRKVKPRWGFVNSNNVQWNSRRMKLVRDGERDGRREGEYTYTRIHVEMSTAKASRFPTKDVRRTTLRVSPSSLFLSLSLRPIGSQQIDDLRVGGNVPTDKW